MTNIILEFEWSFLSIPFLLFILCLILNHSYPYTSFKWVWKWIKRGNPGSIDLSFHSIVIFSYSLCIYICSRRQNKLTKHSLATRRRQTSTIGTSCQIEELLRHASIDLRRIKKQWLSRRFLLSTDHFSWVHSLSIFTYTLDCQTLLLFES